MTFVLNSLSKVSSSRAVAQGIRTIATSSVPLPSPFAPGAAKPRHLLTIDNLTPTELSTLVDRAIVHKKYFKEGKVPEDIASSMRGKTVPLVFSKRSTRTRVSTEAAVTYLGGHPMFLGKDDIQLGVSL